MKNEPPIESLTDDIVTRFAKLVADAPPGPELVTASPQASLLRPSNGWGELFIDETPLRGEEWMATFQEAKIIVSRGGIIALIGGRGPGKTRMAAEIARAGLFPTDKGEWNGNRIVAGKSAIYRRADDLFLALRGDRRDSEIRRTSECGLLVLDELQERGDTPFEDRALSTILDRRYADKKPTVLIANLTRAGLKQALSPSVIDRMRENGKSFEFTWPSFRTPNPPTKQRNETHTDRR